MEKPKLTIAPLISTLNNEDQQFAEETSNISTISRVNPTTRIETMDKVTNVCRIIKIFIRGKIHMPKRICARTHTLIKRTISIFI